MNHDSSAKYTQLMFDSVTLVKLTANRDELISLDFDGYFLFDSIFVGSFDGSEFEFIIVEVWIEPNIWGSYIIKRNEERKLPCPLLVRSGQTLLLKVLSGVDIDNFIVALKGELHRKDVK